MPVIKRVCVACRKSHQIEELIRLTVDPVSTRVVLSEPGQRKARINGRSAYLCRCARCINIAIKNTRLKLALSGRQIKPEMAKRKVSWPLESQLIKDIVSICAEAEKTCQNTRDKEA